MTTRYYSGEVQIHVTALDAIHHGAGSSGNTQLLRTQDVVQPDGRSSRVPFVSGNSLKHMIRDGAVRFALDAMAVGDGTLPRTVVDLLFSGGALSRGGAVVDLESARKLAKLFPVLSMCGYSAGNTIVASKIRVDNLHLVCAENAWRVPDYLSDVPAIGLRAAAQRSAEFGTRHDAMRLPHATQRLALEDMEAHGEAATKRAKGGRAKMSSTQMIYEHQVITAGATLFGGLSFDELTAEEFVALKTGLGYASHGRTGDGGYVYHIGARSSVGWGRAIFRFGGDLRVLTTREKGQPLDTLPAVTDENGRDPEVAEYAARLSEQRDEILDALREAAR